MRDYKELTEEMNEYTNQTPIEHSRIARALARGYTDLYYVNMETDELIEYYTDDERGVLTELRRSSDFFEGCERDVKLFVHPDDQEKFVKAMNREFLTKALKESKVYEMTYRRIKDGRTFYVEMKVSRIEDDDRFVVIAVSDVDELMKRRQEEERIQEERIIYARLQALVGNFIVVYVVDPETDNYREFSATEEYTESFAQERTGVNFFDVVRDASRTFNHPEDLDRFLTVFTKENVMSAIERDGFFSFGYRLVKEGTPIHVQMKAAIVEEKEGPRLIVGLNDIDAQVRQERDLLRQLAEAQEEVSIDALTGVKNRHAYLEAEVHMDQMIYEHKCPEFAIVMLDVNDLKKVNDIEGHQAGDRYLCGACRIICDIFKHSPVFRVGGDEFVVIARGVDYECIEERITQMNEHNASAQRSGGIVVACGMARFGNDTCVASVFERADSNMYGNKNWLKNNANRNSAD